MTVQDYFLKLLQWYENHGCFDLNKDISVLFPDDPDCGKLLNKIIKDNKSWFVKIDEKIYLKDKWENLDINIKIKTATGAAIAGLLNNAVYGGKYYVSPLSISETHIYQLIGLLHPAHPTEKSFSA